MKISIDIEGSVSHVQGIMAIADIADRGSNATAILEMLGATDVYTPYVEGIFLFLEAAQAHLCAICAETTIDLDTEGDHLDMIAIEARALSEVARKFADKKHKQFGTTPKLTY